MKPQDSQDPFPDRILSNRAEGLPVDDAFQARVRSKMLAAGAGKPALIPWLVAAAALLIGLGLFVWNGDIRDRDADATATVDAPAPSIANHYVLSIQVDPGCLVAKDLRTDALVTLAVGAKLGSSTLTGVLDNAMRLRSADGNETLVQIADYNDAVNVQLRAGVESVKNAYLAGRCGKDSVGFLGMAAGLGDTAAIQILEDMARSGGPLREAALLAVGSDQKLSAVAKLSETALTGKDRFRRQAIESLSRLGSPAALNSLRDICAGGDLDMARFAVEQVGRNAGDAGLPVLRHAATHSQDPDLRVLAETILSNAVEDAHREQ